MDVLYCCERAETCLSKARETQDREERRAWHALAAAWIDYAAAAERAGSEASLGASGTRPAAH